MFDQIKLAQASLFVYSLLPTISEFVIEEGYNKCVYTIDDIGGFGSYLAYTMIYFSLVEIGIYWVSLFSCLLDQMDQTHFHVIGN